jgi:hypothetical protein
MVSCSTLNIRFASQSTMGVLASDSRPITGPGDTLFIAGGGFLQPAVEFMEGSLTPVFSQATANGSHLQVVVRRSGAVLVDTDVSQLTDKHDFFLTQLALEPVSGTLTFMTYGLYPAGTKAAGFFVQNTILPQLKAQGDLWYVYQWDDTDMAAGPSVGDTWKKLGSGK